MEVLPDRSAAIYVDCNLKDSVRQGETAPLQFLNEPATCRIFYTTRTVFNYLNHWNYVVDAIWRNPSLCIAGTANGTTNDNAIGPAVNDTATLAVPSPNISSSILPGPQSGRPQPVPDATNQNFKRNSPPPPSPSPLFPASPTPSLSLEHIDDDGIIHGEPCHSCRHGSTCIAVPTCTLGMLVTATPSASRRCERKCSKHHGYHCNARELCYRPHGHLEGFCLAIRSAKAVSHCKNEPTSTSKAQQTMAVGGAKVQSLPHGKFAPGS